MSAKVTARRLACSTAAMLAALCLPTPCHATAAVTLSNWDAAQQREVVAAGLMQNGAGGSFQGAASLTAAQASAAMAALAASLPATTPATTAPTTSPPAPAPAPAKTRSPSPTATASAQAPVTVAAFDALVVQQLGLGPVAAHVRTVAAAAGLAPPSYFGTEVVARFLGLRYNHPVGSDQLELFPFDPITRAEAAWSLDQVLHFGDWNVSYAAQALSGFALSPLTVDERQALQIAVSRIGYPYVYGGTTDDTSDGLAHGGFDCSGFVWRVFKLSGLPWGRLIVGRTAAQMAGEIPRRERLRIDQLQPGDLLFFGTAGFGATATEQNIVHTGIYLGDNWVIHCSSQGVYVLPLQGSWLGDAFAWGRRVIGA
jgi:cell wall-associated NlpC family hydrolase